MLPSIDNLPQPYDDSDWNSNSEPMRRRRRPGRKRKRRPEAIDHVVDEKPMQTNDSNVNDETMGIVVSAIQTFNTETRPQEQLIEKNDWKAISTDEFVQSPVLQVQSQFTIEEAVAGNNDGGQPHHEPLIQYGKQSESKSTNRNNQKAYRRSYSLARRQEEAKESTNSNNGSTSINLKNILKKSGGLSLSEILQQQNLSLDDLLKGKQNALKALQNTAAPPQPDIKDIIPTKSTRRLPSLSQITVVQPRRNFFNGLTRTGDQKLQTIVVPTESNSDVNHSVRADLTLQPNKIISTIPTFIMESSSNLQTDNIDETNDQPVIRRLPPSRGKHIKEVVSAIRPDLNNSNSRKRLPSLKLLQTKNSSEITSTIETILNRTEPIINTNQTITNENLNKTQIEINEGYSKNVDVTKQTNKTEEFKVISTTLGTPISITVPNNNLSLRDRLALRPRIRPLRPTLATSTEQSMVHGETTSEESPPYTIITFTTLLANDTMPSVNSSEVINDFVLNKKLNESTPELNLVELEDENKSKEVSSLEDLFFTELQEETNDEDPDSSSELDSEFLHASTSRSDKYYKSEKPNSQKISGGNFVNIFKKTFAKLDVTERNPSLFSDLTSKFYVDDKTELLDLLGDRRGGARLVKVLKQRNMTLDELIEHRKRGSSQLHLAEIFHNKTKLVETKKNISTPPNVVTAFENFPEFNLESVKSVNPNDIKTDSEGASYFTSITNIHPTAEIYKEGRSIRKPFLINIAESATRHSMPTQHWNTDHTDLNPSSPHSVDHNYLDSSSSRVTLFSSRRAPSIIPRPSTGDSITAFHDVIELHSNDASSRSHDPLDLELSGHGFKRNSVLIENAQMPIGVRSAIIASTSIVVISLAIFMVIFLVCRWRQHRRRKICYSDRFQALRGRLPILSSRDNSPSKRSTSPPIVYCSSRRSSKLNTMDPNSPEVQEYLYDAMRKPFQ